MGKRKNKGGRPTKLTDETVRKLEGAFAIDATVEEACFYAGISKPTFYSWREDNEELFNRFEALRNKPVLKARETVVQALVDPGVAFKYLERKRPAEFMPQSKMEHSGRIDTAPPGSEATRDVAARYEEELRGVIAKEIREKKP